MLSNPAADFVHTGPGTLAGRYLRSFWQPVYRAQDLPPGRAVPIRIMGEDFTLYRGVARDGETGREGDGETGPGGAEVRQYQKSAPPASNFTASPRRPVPPSPHLLAFRCAHRGTQLSVGWVEDDCIRCRYHGWKYDAAGQCVEQPGEDASFAERVRIRSYPIQEYLGLIFAYLSEGQPPPLKRFPDFERPGVLDVGIAEYWPCNYFNRLDNACDIGHVAFTHRTSIGRTNKSSAYTTPTLHCEETAYGIRTAVERTGVPVTYFHFHMPNINQVRALSRVEGSLEDAQSLWVDELFWRVPVDDEHSVTFVVDYLPLVSEAADAYRQRRRETQEWNSVSPNEEAAAVLAGAMRVEDVDERLSLPKRFWIEDYVTQVGQGPTADRESEHLSRMDVGTMLLRKLWERELETLAEGRPLKPWSTPAALVDAG